MALLRLLWEYWKVFAKKVGHFNSRLLLLVFYYLVAAPFAIGLKLLSDPLRLRGEPGRWLPRPARSGDALAAARREF
jgi:hypothetical protein